MKQPKRLQDISAWLGLIQVLLLIWSLTVFFFSDTLAAIYIMLVAQAFDIGKRYCICYEPEEMI